MGLQGVCSYHGFEADGQIFTLCESDYVVGAILDHCYTLAVTNKLVYMIQPYRLCYLVVLMYIDDVKMRPGS